MMAILSSVDFPLPLRTGNFLVYVWLILIEEKLRMQHYLLMLFQHEALSKVQTICNLLYTLLLTHSVEAHSRMSMEDKCPLRFTRHPLHC